MRLPSFRSLTLVPVLGSVLLATACSASGGGTLTAESSSNPCTVSASGTGAVGRPDITFGFHATSELTSGDLVSTFDGTFADACAEVRFLGQGNLKTVSAPPELANATGCLGGLPNYTSGIPTKPGTGHFLLLVCSFGKPSAAGPNVGGDFVEIAVVDGPFADGVTTPYSVIGTVQHGNLVVTQ